VISVQDLVSSDHVDMEWLVALTCCEPALTNRQPARTASFSCKHARLTRRTTHVRITRILRDLVRVGLAMLVDDYLRRGLRKSVCEGLVSKQSQVTISPTRVPCHGLGEEKRA
jgi:hypothetical protein